ncbi:MAG: rod shape-determining protein MreC [Mangrovibacterium sp.]
MRNLWKFLSRFSVFFVFLIFQAVAFGLMSKQNDLRGVGLVGSTIEVVGAMHDTSSSWRDYFSLKRTNQNLSEENARLFAEVEHYKRLYLSTHKLDLPITMQTAHSTENDSSVVDINTDSLALTFADSTQFKFISARVVNNSFNRANNFITIDKGTNDGVNREMGVIGPDGVVGIITTTSNNYAIGPSLLNSRWSVSAKIKHSNYFGTLAWDGKDPQYAQLHEIPFHVKPAVGDTLVTSGYSDVFPEGIPVAVIDTFSHTDGANFLNISAKLLTNFQNLTYVTIVANKDMATLKELNKVTKDDE